MVYKPPYEVSVEHRKLATDIARLIGRAEGYQLLDGNLTLRRQNKIKSLHSSLAIEGNSLTEAQVTAILDGKPVIGPEKDIHEVKNALRVYDELEKIDPYSEDDLLRIHGLLMQGLITDAGRYRNAGVGVVDSSVVVHLAPPARRVPALMGDLFDYLTNYSEDLIIQSCVFHYEFEFIHPFSDGNGRMGRLWQTAILKTQYPILANIPVESMVYARQQEYYDALLQSQRDAHSNAFIQFSLETIHAALAQQLDVATAIPDTYERRIRAYREVKGTEPFTRKEYQLFHKRIGPATATRDLIRGVDEGVLDRKGKLNSTRYTFLP